PPPIPMAARSGELADARRRQHSELLPAVPSMIVRDAPSAKAELSLERTPVAAPIVVTPTLPAGVIDLTGNVPIDTWMANPDTDLLSSHRLKGVRNLALGLVLLAAVGAAIIYVINRQQDNERAGFAPTSADAGVAEVVVDAGIELDAANSMSKDDIVALSRFGFFSITATSKTSIWVDDKLIGETPLTRLPLAPGPHKIKAVGPRGKSKTINVTIYGGKDTDEGTISWDK
ncbi:MAG: hypothetical protein M3680_26095, partial [Myxococcota bacterium]|nr:hypothetical protein [Myxococcota bacterium]